MGMIVREAGLEPATSSLSGMHSNRLSYTRVARRRGIEPLYSVLEAELLPLLNAV